MPHDRGLLISLVLHGFLIWILAQMSVPRRDAGGPISIELTEKNTQNVKVPVSSLADLMPDPLQKAPKEVNNPLIGARTIRVEEQRQAPRLNPTNTFGWAGDKPRNSAPTQESKGLQDPDKFEKSPDGVANSEKPKKLNLPQGQGQSAVRQILPGISLGSVNFMNVDYLTYYTFFLRFEESLLPRWNVTVRDAFDSVDEKTFFRQDRWTTIVDLELDAEGYLKAIKVTRTSGLVPLDNAIVEALRRTAPIRNPPRELMQDNGRIALRLGASVLTRPPM